MPTFNRGSFIAKTLEALLAQATDEVEIVVLDGGSTDETEGVVSAYARRSDHVRYIRQSENLGVDRDMDRSVREARGAYVWLFSSDDLPKPGAIGRVLREIARDPDLLIVNAEIRNFDMGAVLRDRVLRVDRDVDYNSRDRDRFFVDVAQFLSFMGCVVIRRDLWERRVRERFFGTEFTSLAVVLEDGVPDRTKVIAEPLVMIRYGNFTWAPRALEISMFKWPAIIWSLPYRDGLKQRVCPRGAWPEIRRLLYHRALGGFNQGDARAFIDRRKARGVLAFAARLIPILPVRLLNLAAIVLYSRRPGGGDTVYLLRSSDGYWRGSPQHAPSPG